MHRRHNTLLSKDMQNAAYIWHVFWADLGKFFATNAIVAFFRSYEDIFIIPESDHFLNLDFHFIRIQLRTFHPQKKDF